MANFLDIGRLPNADARTRRAFDVLRRFGEILGDGGSLSLDADGRLVVNHEDATTSNKGIASFNADDFIVSSGAVTIKDSGIDHDATTNFLANEHVDHSGVTLTAGEGLTGGGTIAASRSFAVDINGTADLASPAVADELLISDADDNTVKKADLASIVNLADHDALTNFVANEHIDWTASSAGTIHSSNYTDTNTMGSGFTVSATTDSNATTITQGDDLFFAAGTGITCETTADGTVTISSTVTDTNTTYSAATSSVLGLMKLADDTEQSVAANSVSATAGRTYGVQFNSSDQAVVNVPWTDTGSSSTSPLTLTSGAASEIPITVVAHASQSANMTEWEDSSNVVGARITSAQEFSNSGGSTNSELFGDGASSGNFSVAAGYQASTAGGRGVAVGYQAAAAIDSVAVGHTADANATKSLAIGYLASGYFSVGYNASSASASGTAIGNNSEADTAATVCLGSNAAASGFTGVVVVGRDAVPTANNQLVIGSNFLTGTGRIEDVYIGRGVTSTTVSPVTYHGGGGSGTDQVGGNIILAGGKGTGSGAGGAIVFSTSDASSTGTTLQTLTEKARILVSGGLQLAQSSADPSTPATGFGRLWISDGTGSGSDGDVMSINESGTVVNLSSSGGGAASPLTLTSGDAAEIPITVVAHASQSANMTEWEDSSNVLGAHVTASQEFHHTGGGTNSCVYGAGAGVDGDEPRCTSVGVSAICYGDDAVAIGYSAVAGSDSSTANQNNVAIGSGAVADLAACVAIGQGATTSATSGGTAIGFGASVSGNNSVAIGSTAECSGPFGVAIGQGTINTGSGVTIGRGAEGSLAIGYNADSTAHATAIAMGTSATGGALYTVAIGASSNAGHGGSVCIGQNATSTAAHQLVIGSDKLNAAEITDVYIGKGVVDAAPTDTTYHATGGEGANIAGADVTIAGGKGTGSGAGGSVLLKSSTPGSSGTSLQSLATVLEVDSGSKLGFFGATAVVRPSSTGEETGFDEGTMYTDALYNDSTFTGNTGSTAYTLSDIVKHLKTLGLIAS